MNPIGINITMYACRESAGRRPEGTYTLTCRAQLNSIFPKGAPPLQPWQFFGFHRHLFVTIGRPEAWDTLVKMALNVRTMPSGSVTWLGATKRIYKQGRVSLQLRFPIDIFRPPTWPWSKKTQGWFRKWEGGGVSEPVYYVEFPLLTAEVLLGKTKI